MSDGEVDLDLVAVAERLSKLRDRVRSAGGDPQRVRICAVTKGFPAAAVEVAVAAGLTDVGENYAQELVAKRQELDAAVRMPDLRWHMIGTLQSNKVRLLAPHVQVWQTVDRVRLGDELARWAPGAEVMVQVNASGEAGKGGCEPRQVGPLVAHLRGLGLDVRGLMCVGPTDAGQDPRAAFELAAEIAAKEDLRELSMGMSRDLEAAVAAGATTLRIGTALFGGPRPRPQRAPQ